MKAKLSILLLFCCATFGAINTFAQSPFQTAQWIAASENKNEPRAPLFRKSFSVNGKVKSATLFICGLGYQETSINGKPVTDAVLETGFTNYTKRVLYNSYNVTRLLQTGTNAISSELGNSWFNMQSKTIWGFDRAAWRKSPRLIAALTIEYADGRKDTISSNPTWKTAYGASQFNSLHAGEIYDAGKEIKNWKQSTFNDNTWLPAVTAVPPGGVLEQTAMPPVRVIKRIRPVKLTKLSNGKLVYDFGENFAGVVKLTVTGKAGDPVRLSYGESLLPDGSIDKKQNGGHNSGGKDDPEFHTDVYVLKGTQTETFTPRFTYHGFRYVEVTAPATTQLQKSSLEGLFYSTDFKKAGSFESSSTMLNKLYKAVTQSYRSNFLSIPTDCPQREKMGWTADAHIMTDFGLWNFDSASGYKKYLNDIRDAQLKGGEIPGVAPTHGAGYRWIDPEDDDFGPNWGSALPIITWQVYLHTADTSVIKENYESSKRYLNLITAKAEKTGYLYTTGISDFLNIQPTPKAFTSTVIFYHDAKLLENMAKVLKLEKEAAEFNKLADKIKAAFNKEFFDSQTGTYKITTLTALSGALINGLCPDNYQKNVAAQLAAGVRQRNYQADFGVLGTKYVLEALTNSGYADEAYRHLTNTEAGWGKWIKEGATTLYEGWEPVEQSKNHVFFGDFGAWYYRSLAGIKLNENKPGFSNFTIAPVFPKELDWLRVSHQTAFGEIAIKWKRIKSGVELTLTVPKGAMAKLGLKGYERPLLAGTNKFLIK